MKKTIAMILSILMPMAALAASDNSYKEMYDGGSVPDIKAGTDVKLYFDSSQIRLVKDKKDVVVVPASAVTEISDEQDVHRRVGAAIGVAVFTLGIGALLALTKSKKHFIGLKSRRSGTRRAASQCSAIKTTTVASWLGLRA